MNNTPMRGPIRLNDAAQTPGQSVSIWVKVFHLFDTETPQITFDMLQGA